MKLDIKKWNEVRKELEKALKESKTRQRESMQPRWRGGIDDREKANMKWSATTLYAVRAACRGKQHCEEWTIEDAKDKILPQYALPKEEEKPVDIVIPLKV
jgi:hypothetical protein